jgi:hypothetical protein
MDNVVQFKQKTILFNPELKGRLVETTSQYTDRPELAVNAVEQAICGYLVDRAVKLASKLGTALGERITDTLGRMTS